VSNLDPRIEAIRERYGLAREDFWQIPQNKQWVCKHAALEIVAAKADIEWQPPQIIQADTGNGIAVMVAVGKMGERTEWATGEASPKNNKNSYPWAMAEKRAKDRVVLKLVGIHGLVYSEDEADDFKQEPRTTDQNGEAGKREVHNNNRAAAKNGDARKLYSDLQADMRRCETADDLARWWKDAECVDLRKRLPDDWQTGLHEEFGKLGKELRQKDDGGFPGSTGIRNTAGRELHAMEGA
jgi:hypothetical protein